VILRPRQSQLVQRCVDALTQHGNTLAVAPTGCHAPDTPILMLDGSIKPVQDIVLGDQLMGPNCRPRRVLRLIYGRDQMYQIRPLKGQPFVVNADHVLTLVCAANAIGHVRDSVVDIKLRDYLESPPMYRHVHKLFRVAVDFAVRARPDLDPYLLGVMLGAGEFTGGIGLNIAEDAVRECLSEKVKNHGLRLKAERSVDGLINRYGLVGPRSRINELSYLLHVVLGVSADEAHSRCIPDAFKLGSRALRLQVMAGVLDTDGFEGHRKGGFEYVSVSRQLAVDLAFVACSLGLLATVRETKAGGKSGDQAEGKSADLSQWCCHISGDCTQIPTRIARKRQAFGEHSSDVSRSGFTVHPVGEGEYFGFTLDGDGRYLMGDFTVTHNSGKTIMLSAVSGELLKDGAKACVLAHRTELTGQNRAKFERVNPGVATSVIDASEKSWRGQATFAMVQTLSRQANLDAMPKLDLLVIDEAHHAYSPSYRAVIDAVKERNSKAAIFGLTATPNRGDGKGLREVFSNVADQITLGEMIASGHLVPPRTFVVDLGVRDALSHVRKSALDFDMDQVAAIMNRRTITEEVIKHWKATAQSRKTIVFCSTVEHATNVCAAFNAANVCAVLIHGELSSQERESRLAEYESGVAQVVVNVAVLTEGYDYTPTSCVVLLRPSSYKSTFIQMVGRGLRIVDPNEFPGVIKTDCIVLDFGTASLMHGSLEQEVNLDGKLTTGEAPCKPCPQCEADIPAHAMECPLCGFAWEPVNLDERDDVQTSAGALSDFVMSEIDLLKRSNFRWCDLFGNDDALMATGFNAWGGVFFMSGRWFALGGAKGVSTQLLGVGERVVCMARADDWLNDHESADSAHKTRRWLSQPPTPKQLEYLPQEMRCDFGMTRYQASALLSFRFNRNTIQRLVMAANEHIPHALKEAA
jgi:superfamily II DNA or RNA helicase